MKFLGNKSKAATITIILVSTIALSMFAISPVSAAYNSATQAAINAGMHWDINYNASDTRLLMWSRFQDKVPTWVYLTAAPNPVGVGQYFNLVMFNPQVPMDALISNDIRWYYTIDVVKPDGTTETLPQGGDRGSVATGGVINGKFVSDSTGAMYATYIPTQTGNYSFTVNFQEQYYRWSGSATQRNYYGTTMLASHYTLNVAVQADPVNIIGIPPIDAVPQYFWMRPIEGQNTDWYTVSSNWLSGPHDRDNGGAENRYQADGIAPNSPHILWTRPTEDNGVVGGADLSREGNVFNAGSQYQPRFTNPIIMYGRLYYSPNVLTSGSSSLYDCVDLKTGELLWEKDTGGGDVSGLLGVSTTANTPQFGYYYSQDDPNEHGIQNPGWLFTSNYAIGYQPERGLAYLNITGVPAAGSAFGGGMAGVASTFEVMGPAGEILRYVLHTNGVTGSTTYRLAQWNSSKTIPMIGAGSNPTRNQIIANTSARYDWNISFPISFTTTPTIRAVKLNDVIWGSNGSWPTGTSGPNYAYPDEVTIWAVSLKPGTEGQLLYIKNLDIDDAARNTNEMFERASGEEGVFVTIVVPECKFVGYDIYTGTKLFETDAQSETNAYGYFTWPSLISQTQTKLAYGMLYTAGYTGFVSAYDLETGNLVWRQTYPSGGAKIQNFVQMIALICDGKIYVGTHEHSADTPLYKGEKLHCLNATSGEELWTMSGWAYPMTFATADGVLIYWNNYDAQVYALGKGPTSTTVEAPMAGVTVGKSVVIRGTVMDVSAGTKQKEQAARFPNGVAAVSDASQPGWMEYVYQQKAFPTDCRGVEVTIDVLDSNGNYRTIGTATSDASGSYSLAWTPDISGKFTVVARFAGSESYYGSYAETAFSADEAAPEPVQPEPSPPGIADTYFWYAVGGIIATIAIIGIVIIVLMLRKKQ